MDIQSQRSFQPQPGRSSQQKRKDEDKGEPSFICTICWRPQYPPSKPKLLGSSARIVCRPCWKAVLNLSICWVCGEYIVRGDEVVSLAWCFWHRSCFGCLVCGTKMSVPVIEDEGERVGMGVELEEIPLCGVCSVELSGENEGMGLGRGLENVSRYDGGLSRERLQRWSEISNEDTDTIPETGRLTHNDLKQHKRECSRCSHQQRPSTNTGNLHAMLHSAMDTRILADGSTDECGDTGRDSSAQEFTDDERPDVYLSVFDPVGEPAFQPSKTKPLPKWMHLLPSNIHRDREQKGQDYQGQTSLKPILEGSGCSNSGSRSSLGAENGHSESQALSGSVTPTSIHAQKDLPTPPMDIPNASTHTRTGSKITFEPHPKRDQTEGGHRGDRRSQTVESTYMTPPEYPRPKTPFPRPDRPSLAQFEPTSYFFRNPERIKDPWELEDKCCNLALTTRRPTPTPAHTSRQSVSPSPSERYRISPSQSSEYLERYRPKSAVTKHEKYVAKDPEPILSKFKRQKVGNQNLEQVADERKLKRHGQVRNPKLDQEDYGLDPRRKDLNQELRNLFHEDVEEE